MAKQLTKTRDFGWFTENQLAVLFGWSSASAFRKTWRARLPESAVKVDDDGRTNLYWAAKLHELIVEARISQEIERAGGDPDLIGGDSPALERLRAAKAKLAELDLGQRESELVERAAVREMLAVATSPLHKCLDQMCEPCRGVVQRRAKEIEAACGV